MRLRSFLIPLLSAGSLVGCSAADFVNWAASRHGYSVQRDVQYGPGPRHTVDIYIPDHVRPASPLMVFLFGGNWDSGDKATYLFVGQALASRGYITAIPNYRTYPETRFPGFVEDAAAAVSWLATNRARREGRPIVLIGHSAGAHIAMLLALDKHYLADAGTPVCATVAAAVGMAGPYDFLPLKEERYKRIFPEESRQASQPINFSDARSPPILLLVGEADTTVNPDNTARLAARIEAVSGRVRTRVYPGIGHVGLVGAFARPFRGRAAVLDDIDKFITGQEGAAPPFC